MSSVEPSGPSVGLRHCDRFHVTARHTVPQVDTSWPGFQDMPPVLATAMMIAFVEQTCVMALRPHLATGQGTVGTWVDVTHVAATPIGMDVTAEVELVEVDGRSLVFRVSCQDDAGLIGEGTHRRAIVDVATFIQRAQAKSRQAPIG